MALTSDWIGSALPELLLLFFFFFSKRLVVSRLLKVLCCVIVVRGRSDSCRVQENCSDTKRKLYDEAVCDCSYTVTFGLYLTGSFSGDYARFGLDCNIDTHYYYYYASAPRYQGSRGIWKKIRRKLSE